MREWYWRAKSSEGFRMRGLVYTHCGPVSLSTDCLTSLRGRAWLTTVVGMKRAGGWVAVGMVVALAAMPAGPVPPGAVPAAAAVDQVAAAPAPSGFHPPVRPLHLVRPFDPPTPRWSAGHRGVDLAAVPGQEVYAPADGVVSFAGTVVDRVVISITHVNGLISSFEPVAEPLVKGTLVAAGEVIAAVGTSNHCTECVHWGVRHLGEYVDPMLLLGERPRVILLPLDLLDS